MGLNVYAYQSSGVSVLRLLNVYAYQSSGVECVGDVANGAEISAPFKVHNRNGTPHIHLHNVI